MIMMMAEPGAAGQRQGGPAMTAKPIVAATDGSEDSLLAVEWAVREATLRGAPLRIVAAVDLPPRMLQRQGHSGPDTVSDTIRENRDRALSTAAHRAADMAPGLLIDADAMDGPSAEHLTEAASGALMLVVGSKGIGAFAAMVLGSVSRYVATHAPSPVVVVRGEIAASQRQVGVGIRDPETSAAALTFAFEEAALRNATLVAVHVWHSPQSDISRAGEEPGAPGAREQVAEAETRLVALLEDWQKKYPDVPVSPSVVRAHPGRTLVGLSARADLVVIGRRAPHHGPGSVIHALLNHAHGPVATVPSV
jgi:nucleotide-binding universal stress UspA family protein